MRCALRVYAKCPMSTMSCQIYVVRACYYKYDRTWPRES